MYIMELIGSVDEAEICKACQKCCHWMTFILPTDNDGWSDLLEFYKKRGCKIKVIDDKSCGVMVKSPCPWLGEKRQGCTIWGIHPKLCRQYDGRQDPFFHDECRLPPRRLR